MRAQAEAWARPRTARRGVAAEAGGGQGCGGGQHSEAEMETPQSAGAPDSIVGVISKLLTDLVARNDQVRRRRANSHPRRWPPLVHAPHFERTRAPRPLAAALGADASHPLPLLQAADNKR